MMELEFFVYGAAIGFIAGGFGIAALITAQGNKHLLGITNDMKHRVFVESEELEGRTIEGFRYGEPKGPVFTKSSGLTGAVAWPAWQCGICGKKPCNGHGHNPVPMGEV